MLLKQITMINLDRLTHVNHHSFVYKQKMYIIQTYRYINFSTLPLAFCHTKLKIFYIQEKPENNVYENKYTKFKPDIKMTDLLQDYCTSKDIFMYPRGISSTYKF